MQYDIYSDSTSVQGMDFAVGEIMQLQSEAALRDLMLALAIALSKPGIDHHDIIEAIITL